MSKIATALLRDESGVTAVEYGLITALISVAIFASATLLGTSLKALFTTVATFFS